MVTVILILNVLTGLVCLFVAWKIWQLKTQLATIANTLLAVERSVYNVLHGAPGYIQKGQSGTHSLRIKYQGLGYKLQQLQKILALLSLGQALWRRNLPLIRRSSSGKHPVTKHP